jgi:hypothetical protein
LQHFSSEAQVKNAAMNRRAQKSGSQKWQRLPETTESGLRATNKATHQNE